MSLRQSGSYSEPSLLTISAKNRKRCSFISLAMYFKMAVFILEDALSVHTDNASMAVLILKRLDELGQTFVVRLVMLLKYKDGHKTHHVSARTFLRNTSETTHYER